MIDVGKMFRSFRFAIWGIFSVFRSENNMKVHLLATVCVVGAGVFFRIQAYDWLWIALAVGMVWITEMINTAIEKLVDLCSPNFNPIAGAVKDVAAGAVLIAALLSILIGGVVFWPYLRNWVIASQLPY